MKNWNTDVDSGELQSELAAIAAQVQALASKYQDNNSALLAMLRTLEGLHREIRDGVFEASLPNSRQALYHLLKDIEESGGWPYIQRMKLRSLLVNLLDESYPAHHAQPETPS